MKHPVEFRSPLLITTVTKDVGLRLHEVSPVPTSTVTTFRLQYTGEFFRAAYPDSSPLRSPSPLHDGFGSLFFPDLSG